MMNRRQFAAGFTLFELLLTLAVLAILLAMATPSLRGFFDKRQLIAAAEQVYAHVQRARSESLTRSTTMYLRFSADGSANWQYGMSHRNGCDLAQTANTGPNACVIVIDDGDDSLTSVNDTSDSGDLVLMRFTNADHPGITMATANFPIGSDQIVFNPVRGTATRANISLQSPGGKQLRIKVGVLGQIRLCSPNDSVSGYSDTDC